MKYKLSVCLAVRNEEANIGRCLQSVIKWADEIVVVDGASHDQTVAIARQMGARVIKAKHETMFHRNKQKAIDAAKNDWVLLLDADEEVTEELGKEIGELLNNQSSNSNNQTITNHQGGITKHEKSKEFGTSNMDHSKIEKLIDIQGPRFKVQGSNISGYWIPRKNIIFGKWIEHTGWWPDYQLRLFAKANIKYPCRSVHEQPELKGESGHLQHPIIHHHYQNISQFIQRLDVYTDNDARVLYDQKQRQHWHDAIIWPADEFIKRFVTWHGYRDGWHGLILSILQSFSRFIVWAKLWQNRGFTQKFITDADQKVFYILKSKIKEYRWWLLENKIKHASTVWVRFYHRARRKLGL